MALLEGLAALAAKFAGASTVAQVATGVGIATAGVTGAGAVGALPTPVQDTFASTVEAVTPFELPDSGDDATTEVPADVDTVEAEDTTGPEVTVEEVVEDEAPDEAPDEEAVEDEAAEEETGLRGLDNAIAHADEHARAALEAARARAEARQAEQAAREVEQAAREAEQAAREPAREAEHAALEAAREAEQAAREAARETAEQPRGQAGAARDGGRPAEVGGRSASG